LKLNIKEVLTESALFYKDHFKCLIGFSSIYIVIEAFLISQDIILSMFMAQPTSYQLIVMMGSWLILAIGGIVLLVIFGPRFLLAILVHINSLVNKKPLTFEQSYRETKGKYWITLGCIVLVMLISGIPALLLLLLDFNSLFISMLIAALYIAAINALFFLLLPLIALSKNNEEYISRTFQLIKGNYLNVLFLYGLTTSLLYFVYGIIDIGLMDISSRVVWGTFYLLILFFVFPLAQVVLVVVYRKLTRANDTDVCQVIVDDYLNIEPYDNLEEREVYFDE